jgi:hypothetical protein
MRGVITGGWNFVWAAYIVSALILGVYTASVIARYRSALRRDVND